MSSTKATLVDAVRILSSVCIIVLSNAKNREYLISLLQKKSLKQPLFQLGTFSEPLVFKEIHFSERTSSFVL